MRERTRICQECCSDRVRVNDSRGATFGAISAIRRRNVCYDCDARFYTYEIDRDAFNDLQTSIGGPIERGTMWEREIEVKR